MFFLSVFYCFLFFVYYDFSFGLDDFSNYFVFLVFLVFIFCIFFSTEVWSLLVLFGVFCCFFCLSLFWFFILFEFVLLPITVLLLFGNSSERFLSSLFFLGFTFFFSIPFFICVLNGFVCGGISSLWWGDVWNSFLFLFVFLVFCVKFPVFFFHFWLPRAHVESSTLGSIILASCLLNLGSYGFSRFCFLGLEIFSFFYVLSVFGFFVSVICCFFSVDLKALVAFSSVSHMTLLFCCIVCVSSGSFCCCIIISLAHGFVSSLLFFGVGYIYDSLGSRSFLLVRGFSRYFSFFIFWFTLSFLNSSIPFSLSFFGEFFSLCQVLQCWFFCIILTFLGVFFSGCFCFFLAFSLLGFNSSIYSGFSVSLIFISLPFFFLLWLLFFWGIFS